MAVERADPSSPEWLHAAAEHLSRYYFAANWAPDKRVLDVGTGAGYGVAVLRGGGARSIQAIDSNPEALAAAAGRFGGPGTTFLEDDAESLERVATPLDLICSFENIEHLADPASFVRAAANVLAPDGVLICSTPDRSCTPPFVDGRPANPFHVHEWYRPEFADLLSLGFQQVEVRTQIRTRAFELRNAAARALESHLEYLWSNPVLRALRGLGRLSGRIRKWEPVGGFSAASIEDYPIVSSDVAPLLGTSYCHVAICRLPRREDRSTGSRRP